MASGKRIRAILWKYNYSTLQALLSYVVLTSGSTKVRKYEPEIIIRSTFVRKYNYSIFEVSCYFISYENRIPSKRYVYCTCTTTEVNICYERRYEGTTEVSYESIKESTCSCTVHVRVHYCLLRTEEGIFVRKYFRKYFRKYESTTMYGSNDNDTRTVCYRTIFILKMTQIY